MLAWDIPSFSISKAKLVKTIHCFAFLLLFCSRSLVFRCLCHFIRHLSCLISFDPSIRFYRWSLCCLISSLPSHSQVSSFTVFLERRHIPSCLENGLTACNLLRRPFFVFIASSSLFDCVWLSRLDFWSKPFGPIKGNHHSVRLKISKNFNTQTKDRIFEYNITLFFRK
jgi:hypothetical protein